MRVDELEGIVEPRLALAVQLLNGAAQLGDCLFDVVSLGRHALQLGREFSQIFIGLQIDAAQPLAIGLELGQLAVDVDVGGKRGTSFETGERQAILGRDLEGLANSPRLFLAAMARGFKLCLDAGFDFARGRHVQIGRAQGAGCGLDRALGFCKGVSGSLAFLVGAGQFAQQRLALGSDLFR